MAPRKPCSYALLMSDYCSDILWIHLRCITLLLIVHRWIYRPNCNAITNHFGIKSKNVQPLCLGAAKCLLDLSRAQWASLYVRWYVFRCSSFKRHRCLTHTHTHTASHSCSPLMIVFVSLPLTWIFFPPPLHYYLICLCWTHLGENLAFRGKKAKRWKIKYEQKEQTPLKKRYRKRIAEKI